MAVFVECEKGWVAVRSYGAVQAYDNDNKLIKEFKGGGDHFGNFIQAVRSRNRRISTPISSKATSPAPFATPATSAIASAKTSVEDIRDVVKKDDSALEAVDRMIDHLAVANEVDLKATPLTLGRPHHGHQGRDLQRPCSCQQAAHPRIS